MIHNQKHLRTSKLALSAFAIAGITLTVGCSEAGGNLAKQEETALSWASQTVGEPLWQVDAQTAGAGPIIVGDTVVSYTVVDNKLHLSGFNSETGEEIWSEESSTGDISEDLAFTPRLFTGEDGAPLVLNLTKGQQTHAIGSQNFYTHGIQIIDVQTGESVTSDARSHWVASETDDCLSEVLSCAAARDQSSRTAVDDLTVDVIGIDAQGNITTNPGLDRINGLQMINTVSDEMVFGTIDGGAPTAVFAPDGNEQWSADLTKLTTNEIIINNNEHGAYFENLSLSAKQYADENTVVITTASFSSSDGVATWSDPLTTGLDLKSGEILWSAEGDMCYDYLFCTALPTANSQTRLMNPYDTELSRINIRTGELESTESFTDLAPAKWSMVGSGLTSITLGETPAVLSTSSGAPVDLADDQMFACMEDHGSFMQNENSNPNYPMARWKTNEVTNGCTATEQVSDPTDFSKAVVAGGSAEPFATPQWDPFAEQLRVIATENGLAAYRF